MKGFIIGLALTLLVPFSAKADPYFACVQESVVQATYYDPPPNVTDIVDRALEDCRTEREVLYGDLPEEEIYIYTYGFVSQSLYEGFLLFIQMLNTCMKEEKDCDTVRI